MAQTPVDNTNLLPVMATSLGDIEVKGIKVSEVGLLGSDASLLAPIYNDRKIVLDLTPGEDDWLEVLEVNASAMAHHEGEETQALHLAVRLSAGDASKLELIERTIQKAMGYKVIT